MFVTGGTYTRKVAAEVGTMLKYLFEHPEDKRFFELALAGDSKTGTRDEMLHVRLIDDVDSRIHTLANGREVIRCITSSGRTLDIIFGHPAERATEPALVLLEEQQ